MPRIKIWKKSWSQQLSTSEKLRTYEKFKNIFKFEKYLQSVDDHNDRNSMTRLRFSNSRHRLQINIGRYTIPKTHIHDRLCKNCSDNLVEDEVHLLLECSKFNDLMRDFVSSCFNKNINRSNDISSKFIWLLSNEDNDVCRKIARFIKKNWFG